jgi:hypothetical protein
MAYRKEATDTFPRLWRYDRAMPCDKAYRSIPFSLAKFGGLFGGKKLDNKRTRPLVGFPVNACQAPLTRTKQEKDRTLWQQVKIIVEHYENMGVFCYSIT